jgi:hypothetical protein
MASDQVAAQDEPQQDPPAQSVPAVVSLGRLRLAARMDPRPGPRRTHAPEDVTALSLALIDAGMRSGKPTDRFGVELRDEYAKWQDGCQVPTLPDDRGVPDPVTLRSLSRRAGFRVVD